MKHLPVTLLSLLLLLFTSIGCGSDHASLREDAERAAASADSLISKGDYQNAMVAYIKVLELADRAESDSLYVASLGNIGSIYAFHDDYEKAITYYKRALEAARERQFKSMPGNIVANLVMMNKAIGNKKEETKYTKMLRSSHMSNQKDSAFYALYIPFLNHLERGDDDSVRVVFQKMLDFISHSAYGPDQEALLYNHLGMRHMEKMEYDSAMYCYKTALRLLDTIPKASFRQAVYTNMCELFRRLDMPDSLTFYRGKMVENSDSSFNMRNFSTIKERLDAYENGLVERDMRNLRLRATIAWVLGVSVAIILLIIIVYSKKVNRARKVVVERNEKLLSENNDLRTRLDKLEAGAAEATRSLALKEEVQERLANEILSIMNDHTSVFNPDYNITMLALQLNTNVRYVTEAIKRLGASNFRNLINEYRIREACVRLSDKETYGKWTIAAIAQSVGFNSDNSFILAFKKVMGMTPAHYRKYSSTP